MNVETTIYLQPRIFYGEMDNPGTGEKTVIPTRVFSPSGGTVSLKIG